MKNVCKTNRSGGGGGEFEINLCGGVLFKCAVRGCTV